MQTLDPCSMNLCFDLSSCFLTTTMPPSPPPTMSARDQRAANRTAALPVVPAKAKSTSRKRQQSNADESVTKRNKTVGNESDDGSAVEEVNDAEKEGKKGKKGKKTGAKGKKKYLFYFWSALSLSAPSPLTVERQGLIVSMKKMLRMPRALLLNFSHVYFNVLSHIKKLVMLLWMILQL